MRVWLMSAVVVVCGVSMGSVARADDDVAFATGQFTGAATFCGVPRTEVLPVAMALLKMAGVDASGPSPEMTRFTAGVADGVREMKDNPPATCDEVKEGFSQMKAKLL